MQSTNLLHLPAAGAPAGKPKRAESKLAAEQQDVLVMLAEMLPQLSVDREAATAALSAINDQAGPRAVVQTPDRAGFVLAPFPEEREAERRFEAHQRSDAATAKRHLEACQAREAAGYFASECLALRVAIRAAAPAIAARILACADAVDRERAKLQEATATSSNLCARRDALRVQRENVSSSQAEVVAAEERLANAADSGDDAGAEAAAREIARIRRKQVETIEPLDLRLQAAHEAAARAEVQQTRAEEQFAAAAAALRQAELDKLKLARDEAAVNLRDRDIDLAAAGYFERGSTEEYRIGMTPEVLDHLGGRRQEVTGSFIDARATQRRIALEPYRPEAT